MSIEPTPFPHEHELLVDNFAGGGGASTGIYLALGRHVDIACNHAADALLMHAANHPTTLHLREDVFKVDPRAVTQGRPVGLAWFSPDCKHFSKAKGGKPRSKKIRGLAWVAVKWAALVRPRVIMLENVEEFQDWGPLLPDGNPCPRRKGKTFRNFIARLRNLGYAVEHRELRACDYGAPTIRKRLFLIARCDRAPIVWPEPTHGDPKSEAVKLGRLLPWRTAAECIDWSIPCPSIFLTKEEAKALRVKRPLAEATLRRVARGLRKFVLENPAPFVVKYHSAKREGDDRVGPLDDPLPTQTSENRFAFVTPYVTRVAHGESDVNGKKRGKGEHSLKDALPTQMATNEFALIAPVLTEHANASSARSFPANEPLRTQCAQVKGGHFAACCAFLAKHFGGHETPGAALDDGMHTVTAKDHHGLVVSHLSKLYGTTTGQGLDEAMHTVTGGGNHLAEVRAFLIKYYGEGGQDQDLFDPMHTLTTKDRLGLVTIHGEEYVITDIGLRMLKPHELYAAQGFPADYIIAPEVPVKRGKKTVLAPLPADAQVRMVGNSVCPPLAAALVRENLPDLVVWKEEAAA